jgi:hypothetical protein
LRHSLNATVPFSSKFSQYSSIMSYNLYYQWPKEKQASCWK